MGLRASKLSGLKGVPDNLRSPESVSEGGGRGEIDLRVGVLRAGPRDIRLSIGLCTSAGLTARGLIIGAGSW